MKKNKENNKASHSHIKQRKSRLFWKKVQRFFYILIFAIIVGFSSVLYFSGEYKKIEIPTYKIHEIAAKTGLLLKFISIEGNQRISDKEIFEKISSLYTDVNNTPITMIDLKMLAKEIETIPWVKKAYLSRQLPDKVKIRIKEQEPAALWQNSKKIWLIDVDGALITNKITEEFKNFKIVVSENSADAIEGLKIINSIPEMAEKIYAISRVGGRRWDLDFNTGLTVKLPEQNPLDAIEKLQKMHSEKNIFDRDIAYIDLRIEGKVIVGRK
jgi:cell division protein FtsQ